MNKLIKLLIIAFVTTSHASSFNPAALGGFAISVDLFKYILNNLEKGGTILELGSGSGTGELAKFYKVYSIEHDKNWLNKYNTTYIYAPIVSYQEYKWFNIDILKKSLPTIDYDLILVDGPPGTIGRAGFFYNLALFDTAKTIIFDDVQRGAELVLLKNVSQKLNRPYKIIKCSDGKVFGVINARRA